MKVILSITLLALCPGNLPAMDINPSHGVRIAQSPKLAEQASGAPMARVSSASTPVNLPNTGVPGLMLGVLVVNGRGQLQGSTDLVHWTQVNQPDGTNGLTEIVTNLGPNGSNVYTTNFVLPKPAEPFRFYRVQVIP